MRTLYAKSWSFPTNTIFHPAHVAGLFFCLAPAESAGLLFCSATIRPRTSVYSAFCAVNAVYRPRNKTARRALQALFLRFIQSHHRRYQTDTSGYNTACTTLEHITAPHCLQRIPGYHHHAGTLYRSAQPPYYNKVYKAQRCPPVIDLCQTVQHTTDHASPAACNLAPVSGQGAPGQSGTLHPTGQSSGGAARNHWRLAPHLFSGFRPIANRGQQ